MDYMVVEFVRGFQVFSKEEWNNLEPAEQGNYHIIQTGFSTLEEATNFAHKLGGKGKLVNRNGPGESSFPRSHRC